MLALYAILVATLLAAPPGNPGSRTLAAYLERAGLTWLALPDCGAEPARCAAFERQEREPPAAVADRVHIVAQDVASVVWDGFAGHPEERAYRDDPQGARTGLLVMSLAFNESRFRGSVASGKCDIPALGTCDHGRASTLWQIHVGNGLYVGWGRWMREFGSERSMPDDVLVTRDFALQSFPAAATLALHMARASLKTSGSLRNYTGEWEGPAPHARAREELAAAYYRAHPYAARCTGLIVATNTVQCLALEETTP